MPDRGKIRVIDLQSFIVFLVRLSYSELVDPPLQTTAQIAETSASPTSTRGLLFAVRGASSELAILDNRVWLLVSYQLFELSSVE